MKKQYTVDEINEGKIAVLLDRENESNQIDLPLKNIPVKIKEGDILNIEFKGNKIIFAEVDVEATNKVREEAEKMLNDLKKKVVKNWSGRKPRSRELN